MCLPLCELERAGDQDDYTDRNRHRARQRRLLHLDRRQRVIEAALAGKVRYLDEQVLSGRAADPPTCGLAVRWYNT
jgi:hypothetical protein